MLDIHRLRVLRDLHRLGTLAQVARSLHCTPSAVSHQLAQLEKETGTALLEKVGRGVRLTPDAVRLVEHAEAVLARLEEAEAELAGGGTAGTVRIAAFQSAVLTVAPAALDLMAAEHPGLRVEIVHQEIGPAYEALLAHDVDMVIGEEYPGLPEPLRGGIERTDLFRDPLRLVVPETPGPTGEPGRVRSLADLSETSWALDPADVTTGQWARARCRAAGFEPKVLLDTVNPLLQVHLVRTGHAAAFVPALVGEEFLGGTRVIGLPEDPHRVIFVSARAGRTRHPGIVACREAFAEAVRRRSAPSPGERLAG